MKIIKTLGIITTLALLIVIAPWVFTFYGKLPTNTNDWAYFGSYLGGTLSPVIALMALVAFLYTINQQQKQIILLSQQAVKEDLFKMIKKIEKDFYENLKQHPVILNTDKQKYTYSAIDVLLELSFSKSNEVIFNEEDIKKITAGKSDSQLNESDVLSAILSASMFTTATSQLNQLRTLVKNYDDIANNNILSIYYKKKYKTAYIRLHNKGLIKNIWDT